MFSLAKEDDIFEDSDNEEVTKKFKDYLVADQQKCTIYFKQTVNGFKDKINVLTEQNEAKKLEIDRLKRNINEMRMSYYKELSSLKQKVCSISLKP